MVNPPSISLKVIVVAHFVLTVWASMAQFFLPPAYIYMNAGILAMGVWGIINPESAEAIFMFLIVNGLSILLDIIFLSIYNPRAHDAYEGGAHKSYVHEYRFCLGMSIVNLLIKPFTCFVLYRIYQDRGGQYSDLNIPGLHNFGVSGAASFSGGPASSTDYENIDQSVPPNLVDPAPTEAIDRPLTP